MTQPAPEGRKTATNANRPREITDLRQYKVRHFAMPGNLGAEAMAKLLVKNDI